MSALPNANDLHKRVRNALKGVGTAVDGRIREFVGEAYHEV